MAMKRFIILSVAVATILSCGKNETRETQKTHFNTIVRLRTTPVKNQGRDALCWAYAMLATIESEHLMQGDSVNLSPAFVARMLMRDGAERLYLTRGASPMSARGTMPMLVDIIMRHGLMPYSSYSTDKNINVMCRTLQNAAHTAVRGRKGLSRWMDDADVLLDQGMGPLPYNVYMYGVRYTPLEFARSVCRPGEYVALTSYTHHPFGKFVDLELPDNHRHDTFLNLPIDTLMSRVEASLLSGHPVCWEGSTHGQGFSFARGTARLHDENRPVTQEMRQRSFERFSTTDDHCMAIVGIARDDNGNRWFICKNSWGTGNPYGGFMYMSYAYARLHTVAVMMKGDVSYDNGAYRANEPCGADKPYKTHKHHKPYKSYQIN